MQKGVIILNTNERNNFNAVEHETVTEYKSYGSDAQNVNYTPVGIENGNLCENSGAAQQEVQANPTVSAQIEPTAQPIQPDPSASSYTPPYSQSAGGTYSQYQSGGSFSPASRPESADITYGAYPHMPDPEKTARKRKIKQLANASTVPLLIYGIGGVLIVNIIYLAVTVVCGDLRAAQIFGDPDFLYILNGLLSIILFSLPMLITSAWTKHPLSETVAFKRFDKSTGISVIMLGFGVIAASQYGSSALSYILSTVIGRPIKNPAIDYGTGTFSMLISLACVGVIPALMEEFAFRGVILGTARRHMSDGCAVILTTVLFSLLHGNLFQIPFTFMLGLYLGYITVYTGSVWPAVILHGINNCASVLVSYAQSAASSDFIIGIIGGFYYLVFLLVGLCGLIFLIKSDKNGSVFRIDKKNSEHTGENIKWFITAPWMIVFFVYSVIEVILNF